MMDLTSRWLCNTKDKLEVQVAEKTKELHERLSELERFRDATVDREFRIKEPRDELEKPRNKKS